MDTLLSAVASDLIGRLIAFLIGKYQENSDADTTATAVRLQRTLLRARAVLEEAAGRQIANRTMLQQLNQLRQELCRATYALDAFRWRDRRSQATVRRSQAQARPPPTSSSCSNFLSAVAKSLEDAQSDMREFVVLLNGCPRATRRPYSAYLFMESCMFGRQMEKEQIINFLLQPTHQDLDVLPIIGPHEVGKRTLVEHVCLDERVQERFNKIHHLSNNELVDLQSHEHHWSMFDFTARSLIVIDMVDGNADAEEPWRRFSSAVRCRAHGRIKIIIISREVHSNLGTVTPLKLHAPRREELWYFFRVLAFGAADPDERPELAHIAMALCDGIRDLAPFAAANIIAASLHTDLSVRSWRRLLKVASETTVLQLGAANDGLDEYKAGQYYHCRSLRGHGVPCLFYNTHKLTSVARSELPKVTLQELLTGGSLPLAEGMLFEVLMWQSRIPPYASYVATCDTDVAHHQQVVEIKKRLRNKRTRDHQEDGPTNN